MDDLVKILYDNIDTEINILLSYIDKSSFDEFKSILNKYGIENGKFNQFGCYLVVLFCYSLLGGVIK